MPAQRFLEFDMTAEIRQAIQQEGRIDKDSDKLFEVVWAEEDQYFVLIYAQNEKQALRGWQGRYKEHWCAELISRKLCGGPRVQEVTE